MTKEESLPRDTHLWCDERSLPLLCPFLDPLSLLCLLGRCRSRPLLLLGQKVLAALNLLVDLAEGLLRWERRVLLLLGKLTGAGRGTAPPCNSRSLLLGLERFLPLDVLLLEGREEPAVSALEVWRRWCGQVWISNHQRGHQSAWHITSVYYTIIHTCLKHHSHLSQFSLASAGSLASSLLIINVWY